MPVTQLKTNNMYRTEQQMQADLVMWFSHNYPAERGMLHCNNNNSWNRTEGTKAKALGVVPGASDLELITTGPVVFLELKLPGKKQSEEQLKWMDKLIARGKIYIVIETKEMFIQKCRQYLGY